MNDKCKAIHETSLGNIIDIWDTVKNLTKEDFDLKFKNNSKNKSPMSGSSSIAKASSNLTLVFPVLCSRGISIENASMISKALEKNAVSMMQRLFASWQVADKGDVNNFADYLAAFHKNISTKTASLDDVFRIIDSQTESANILDDKIIKDDLDNLDFVLPDDISESSLMRFKINESAVDHNTVVDSRTDTVLATNKNVSDIEKTKSEFFKNQIPDSEYKKANELMPTSMAVNFYISDDDNKTVEYTGALAAVKCKLYPISSDDIVFNLSSKISNRNWITGFLRASTREISFVKDFILAIDKAKIDALSMSDRNKTSDKMWKVLERRALTSRINKIMRRGDGASVAAITTLVISQEEVDYISKYNNIDIEKVGTVLGLFSSLNLMCICIVDESLEVAKFIYDEQEPMWETISFTHLERESSDNTYKRVVNLMTKVSR